MEWSKLGMNTKLCEILTNSFGFKGPTPVQKAGIPHFMGNKDICIESCTGSGKTLTFLIPIFHKIMNSEFPCLFAMIISPSRELAMQTFEVAEKIALHYTDINVQCVIGGHSKNEDIEKLDSSKKSILIGTPGRIADLIEGKNISLKGLEVLVLDEADRLLDMGFKETVGFIIEKLPKHRRTGLFSATMTTDVENLIKAGLRNPVYINIKINKQESQSTPLGLTNYYCLLPSYYEKLPLLVSFLQLNRNMKIIVFFSTCASTNFYKFILIRLPQLSKLKFFRLHGKMKQGQRERIYKDFSDESSAVLLTTDLIARGIDFPDIKWIVQFDPPQNPDFFVHRIGRTARANRTGDSLLLLTNPEDTYLSYLEMRNIKLIEKNIPFDDVWSCVRAIIIEDREGYEKAQAAFVAYIRYYKEHHLNFIFEFKKLDLGFLAQGFALLRIPRINEILGKHIENFVQSEIDPDSIKYKDGKREAQRQLQLKEKEELISQRRQLKEKTKKTITQRKRSRSEKRDAKKEAIKEDFDILGKEERIIKKIKKGKMNDIQVKEYILENPHYKTFFRKKKH